VATYEEKLNGSLARLQTLTKGGRTVFAAREMGRVHRDRLIAAGHLTRIIGGWMLRSRPGMDPNDGIDWWASYWTFCAAYCESRFGTAWHLSAEQSVLLHVDDTVVPAELVVCAPKGQNNDLELLHGTALYDLREATPPAVDDLVVRNGLRLYTLDAALVKVPEGFYVAHPLEAQLALRAIPDASGLLRRLLRTGQPIVAGRLAGALRHIGRIDLTDDIMATMRSAGHVLIERNPFTSPRLPIAARRGSASIVARLAGLYALGRASIADHAPAAPGRIADPNHYLESLTERQADDAFHGLWLEGLVVTHEAIEQAAVGAQAPPRRGDVRDLTTLTALGDLQAFRAASRSIGAILGGAPLMEVLREAHREWHREFLQPRVTARLTPVAALAGYRDDRYYLSGSRFVPPEPQSMRAAMPALFDLLEGDSDPFLRAVLARWLVCYLHPYREGNDRIAHFLMNAFLATGGWQWLTLRGTDQDRYRDALERANLSYDLGPLAALIREGLVPVSSTVDAAVAAAAPAVASSPAASAPMDPDGLAAESSSHYEAIAGVGPTGAADTTEPVSASASVAVELAAAAQAVMPVAEVATPPALEADASQGVAADAADTAQASTAAEPATSTKKSAKAAKAAKKYAPKPTQIGLFGD